MLPADAEGLRKSQFRVHRPGTYVCCDRSGKQLTQWSLSAQPVTVLSSVPANSGATVAPVSGGGSGSGTGTGSAGSTTGQSTSMLSEQVGEHSPDRSSSAVVLLLAGTGSFWLLGVKDTEIVSSSYKSAAFKKLLFLKKC